ncbi:9998_t:CDS:2 [Funneliformis geosporum]|nr:9998_t:CDS:2 [Funneliformis geosporum]
MVKQLSTWLRSGVIDKSIKDNFRLTLDTLYDTCLLKIFRRSLRDSLHNNLYNDQAFHQVSTANITVFGWFENQRLSKLSSYSSSKQPGQPKIKRACAINNSYANDKTTRRDPSPSLRQKLSFTDSEQGAFVEHIINLAKKAICKFFVDNERNIPLNIQLKKNVQNKMAHGIVIDDKGRWSDHSLQNVAILVCEVVICVGSNYEDISAYKENVDSEIV